MDPQFARPRRRSKVATGSPRTAGHLRRPCNRGTLAPCQTRRLPSRKRCWPLPMRRFCWWTARVGCFSPIRLHSASREGRGHPWGKQERGPRFPPIDMTARSFPCSPGSPYGTCFPPARRSHIRMIRASGAPVEFVDRFGGAWYEVRLQPLPGPGGALERIALCRRRSRARSRPKRGSECRVAAGVVARRRASPHRGGASRRHRPAPDGAAMPLKAAGREEPARAGALTPWTRRERGRRPSAART